MGLARRDTQQHTYGEYYSWPDEECYELIDGWAYIKEPPAPMRPHQELVGELHLQIKLAIRGKPWRVYIAPFDVRLPRKAEEPDEQIDTVVQPDVLVVCDLGKLDLRGMRGAPDWVAEVLSPSTAGHDRNRKLPVYERAGVREVWLVDPARLSLAIFRLTEGRYGPPHLQPLEGGAAIDALPGVSIDLGTLAEALR